MNMHDDAQIEQMNEEVVNGDVEETPVEIVDEPAESVDAAEDADAEDADAEDADAEDADDEDADDEDADDQNA